MFWHCQCSSKLFSLHLVVQTDFLQSSAFSNFAKKGVEKIKRELGGKLGNFLPPVLVGFPALAF